MISEDDRKEQAAWYIRLLSFDPGRAWYTINGDDYLGRGHMEGGLQGKLKKYLEGQVYVQSVCLGMIANYFRVLIQIDTPMLTLLQPLAS
jgi:hypothetical protein